MGNHPKSMLGLHACAHTPAHTHTHEDIHTHMHRHEEIWKVWWQLRLPPFPSDSLSSGEASWMTPAEEKATEVSGSIQVCLRDINLASLPRVIAQTPDFKTSPYTCPPFLIIESYQRALGESGGSVSFPTEQVNPCQACVQCWLLNRFNLGADWREHWYSEVGMGGHSFKICVSLFRLFISHKNIFWNPKLCKYRRNLFIKAVMS